MPDLTPAQEAVVTTALRALRGSITTSDESLRRRPWVDYDPSDPAVPGALTHGDGWLALIDATIDGLEDPR